MFWNNLKYTIRELLKSKVFTLVNVFGLTLAFISFMYLFFWVKSENSIDKYHTNRDSIYRLVNKKSNSCFTPTTMKSFIELQIPEIRSVSRIRKEISVAVKTDNQSFIIDDLLFADNEFLSIYSHKFIHGNPENCLVVPNSIVLTETLAVELFGNKNPVGQSLSYENFYDYTVVAVIEDTPVNSSLQYDAIVSFISLKDVYAPFEPDFNVLETDGDWSFYTLVLADETVNIDTLNNKISASLGNRYQNWFEPEFYLQPLNDFYFSKLDNDNFIQHGNHQITYILIIVALFIILLAFINYMNLSTARSSEKFKNFSILRFAGANKFHLSQPSIIEAIFIVSISLAFSFLLLKIISNNLINGLTSSIYSNENIIYIICISLILFALGIAAGIFPALFLMKYKLATGLNKISDSMRNPSGKGRKALILFQFLVSIGLIISTISVYKQIDFLKNSGLGFNKESVVYLKVRHGAMNKADALKEELLKSAYVKSVSFSDGLPGNVRNGNAYLKDDDVFDYNDIYADPDYVQTLGLEIIEGRNFSWDMPTDFNQNARIVNETAVREFGWENPLDETINGSPVIGVMKDFHFRSMHEKITPVTLRCQLEFNTINLRIETKNISSTISAIKKDWNKMVPDLPFELFFLDDTIQKLYTKETKFGKTLGIFAIISIIISALGIFGLSFFTINQRIKEIGIRKVNGAKVSEILTMLNKDFIKWVAIAFVVATPIAYFAMHKWLENFAYKTNLSWWIFALAGLLALGIALLTVSWQSWRAATRNPVEALRYE